MTPYAWPVYQIRLEFGGRLIASAFGLEGLRATIPYLEPELYAIYQSSPLFWLRAGTAARHESGGWTLTLADGREIRSRGRRAERDPRDFDFIV